MSAHAPWDAERCRHLRGRAHVGAGVSSDSKAGADDLELVRAGIQRSRLEEYHDLDDLAGTWSDQEAQEFLDVLAEMDSPILTQWSNELSIHPSELRQALMPGLAQLRKQQQDQEVACQAVEVLLSTGRARRLPALPEDDEPRPARREPLKLPGMPLSEILIAQRRGEL